MVSTPPRPHVSQAQQPTQPLSPEPTATVAVGTASSPQRTIIAAKGGNGMSRAEFEDLGTEELIKYLASKKVVLSDMVPLWLYLVMTTSEQRGFLRELQHWC